MRTRLAAHSRQVLIGSLIALFLVLPDIAAALPAGDPIGAAWERARAAGTYRFTADIVQTSAPEASVASIGQQGKQERLRMEGRTDLPHGTMAFTLWSGGGSAADPASGIEVKVEDERAFMRQAGQPWQEMGDFRGTLAPGGDFLAFLAAARDVTFQGRESRDGLALTRYSFVLDGPRFAEAMRLQSERLLIARGELLPGARLEPSPTYTKMTGSGEIWIGDDGLPYRQALAMQFPAADGRQISPSAPPFVASLAGLRAALAALGEPLRPRRWRHLGRPNQRHRRPRGRQRHRRGPRRRRADRPAGRLRALRRACPARLPRRRGPARPVHRLLPGRSKQPGGRADARHNSVRSGGLGEYRDGLRQCAGGG